MSDTISTTTVLDPREEVRTSDLLLPAPRRSPEAMSPGQIAGRAAAAEEPDYLYPGVRYAMECLESVGRL